MAHARLLDLFQKVPNPTLGQLSDALHISLRDAMAHRAGIIKATRSQLSQTSSEGIPWSPLLGCGIYLSPAIGFHVEHAVRTQIVSRNQVVDTPCDTATLGPKSVCIRLRQDVLKGTILASVPEHLALFPVHHSTFPFHQCAHPGETCKRESSHMIDRLVYELIRVASNSHHTKSRDEWQHAWVWNHLMHIPVPTRTKEDQLLLAARPLYRCLRPGRALWAYLVASNMHVPYKEETAVLFPIFSFLRRASSMESPPTGTRTGKGLTKVSSNVHSCSSATVSSSQRNCTLCTTNGEVGVALNVMGGVAETGEWNYRTTPYAHLLATTDIAKDEECVVSTENSWEREDAIRCALESAQYHIDQFR